VKTKLWLLLLILFSGGCVSANFYQWQAFKLDDGYIVIFNCRCEDYSPRSEEKSASLARSILLSEFSEKIPERYRSIEILKIGFSEGHQADVLAIVGTVSFIREWKAKGVRQVGIAAAELRQRKRVPDLTYRREQ
jgi:hypothetical protein